MRDDTDTGLTVVGLRAGYGPREVLHGVDLTVAPGTVSLLLGANGAGKSTTLGAIIGRVERFGGSISFGDFDLAGADVAAAVRQGVQLVPEGGRVFRDLSVRDNLRLGAFTRREDFSSRLLEPVIDIFPRLGERLEQQAGTLSGGERQMLAIGRALMAAPRLLLLDEPFVGLAPVIVGDVLDALQRINTELGISMLVVEQNIRATDIADIACILGLGEVVHIEQEPVRLQGMDESAVEDAFFGK